MDGTSDGDGVEGLIEGITLEGTAVGSMDGTSEVGSAVGVPEGDTLEGTAVGSIADWTIEWKPIG